jgi:hypothetical protein
MLREAADKMNGRGDDAFGNLNHAFGGAFLVPFTSRAGGELTEDKKLVIVRRHGKEIRLPNDYLGHYGSQWNGMDTGMVTLQPRQSTEWHVRLEMFDPPAA